MPSNILLCIPTCITYTPPAFAGLLISASLLSFFAFIFVIPINLVLKFVLDAFILCLFIIFLYSFNVVIISDPGRVVKNWQESEMITSLSVDTLNETIPLQNYDIDHSLTHQVKSNGQERYCQKCMLLKPDRAHHCSACNTCVLRFDHHCPWVMNCIGFGNYKLFLVFIFWGFMYSFSIMILMLILWQNTPPYFIYSQGLWFSLASVFLFIMSIAFSISFLGFLAFHS